MLQSPWQISLFGGFTIRQRARGAEQPATNQMAVLIALLADRIGRQMPRTELVDELWPSVEDEAGRNRFRVLLAAMRRMLEPPGTPQGSVVICDRTLIGLSANACSVDIEEFQRCVHKANQAPSREVRIAQYRAADQLYGGDFLSGRTSDWIYSRRAYYARLQSLAQFKFSALLEESGDITGAMQQINRSIEADPLREAPRRRALRFLVESGDIGSALAEFEEYRKLLKRSVGLVPTTEFQDWIKGLKSWAGSTRTKSEATADPEVSEETGKATAPAPQARIFLPPTLTTFVGRTSDITELSDVLPLYRWITVTGPGGIGKSRLAIETARANASRFGGGIFYVPVGDLSRPSTLLETIVQQIQLDPSADPLDQLKRYLSQPVETGRNACLFVLDSVDQLSTEANQVFLRLLGEIPNATILATGRVRRGAPGEHEFAIGPLPIPEPEMQIDQLMANPCVQLFFERAQAASARFSVTRTNAQEIMALCRRLEGIPLAIELAAAQAGKASPSNILERLGDLGSLKDAKGWREPRHRSLQASLAFSLDTLDEREQKLFCALCVFRGSFDAAAAGIVAGASSEDLAKLANHSLLNPSSNPEARRYSMLDMVREFGWARLNAVEKEATYDRHASYYRQLVADVETLHMSSGIQQFSRLRQEIENLRNTAERLLQNGEPEAATRFASGLIAMWINCGFQQEGLEYVRRLRESLTVNESQEARLDMTEGILACFLDDPVRGRSFISKALPVIEKGGYHIQAAAARWTLGFAAHLAGEYEEALACAQQMEPLIGEYHARWQAFQRNLMGYAYCELGQFDKATEMLLACQANWIELGDLIPADYSRLSLARVSWKRGELALAWTEYHAIAITFKRWKDVRGLAYSTEGLGRVASDQGRHSDAIKLLGAAQRLRESVGLGRDFADRSAFDIAVVKGHAALGAAYDSTWQAGYALGPDKVAQWLETIGDV